jgi:hypothetical protein
VCVGRSGKLLPVLASIIMLDSEPHGNHDHVLLSHDSRSREAVSFYVCPIVLSISIKLGVYSGSCKANLILVRMDLVESLIYMKLK